MWKDIVQPDRPHDNIRVIRRMRLACWITKGTNIHSETIIYNKPTRCNSGSIVFINNYKYALHFGHGIVQCAPTLTSTHDLFQQNS